MGLFLSQPVKVVCRDIAEIRAFLSTCRYVSDQEQFGVKDHWMAPEVKLTHYPLLGIECGGLLYFYFDS